MVIMMLLIVGNITETTATTERRPFEQEPSILEYSRKLGDGEKGSNLFHCAGGCYR